LAPVLIIGGGVIGLGIGWQLVRQGVDVLLLERGQAGRAASWQSGGMLAADAEIGFEEPELYTLTRQSRELWPDFAAAIEKASGMSVDYRTEGTLMVADDRDAAAVLRRKYEFQRREGLEVEWLSAAEALEMEPFLAPRLSAAVYSAGDHQLDNKLLMTALREAFVRAGGRLQEQTPVRGIRPDATGPVAIAEDGTEYTGSSVVVAAGAWSRRLEGLEAAPPPVRPIKGQMFELKMEDPFDLRHVVRGPRAYLVPKTGGRLLVGATSEDLGFDESVTAGGMFRILEGAWEIVPGIYDLPLVESWAGLRPGSRDNRPLVGWSALPGVFYATGHFRHGIMLAAVTAIEAARMIGSGETSPILEPFSPLRFQTATIH
jgi:glycine oxidase